MVTVTNTGAFIRTQFKEHIPWYVLLTYITNQIHETHMQKLVAEKLRCHALIRRGRLSHVHAHNKSLFSAEISHLSRKEDPS